MTHVILQEFYEDNQVICLLIMQAIYRYAICIDVDEDENGYKAGRFLRASDLGIKVKW